MKTSFLNIISILLFFILLIPGCTAPQSPAMGFNPVLSVSGPPDLGKPVKVSLSFVSPDIKGPEGQETYYSALIELTPGVYELVDGSLQTKGVNLPGETHTLEATIKSIKTTSSSPIYGRVALHTSPDQTGGSGDSDVLFISITNDGATVSKTTAKNQPKTGTITTTPSTIPPKTTVPYSPVPPKFRTRPPNVK